MRVPLGSALLALLASGSGCAGHARGQLAAPPWVGARVPAAALRERLLDEAGEAVWRGDLAAAEVALTALADRERGRPDSALDFWSEMLALLRCEPLGRVPQVYRGDPPLSDPWEQLRRLVQIERVRLSRALPVLPKVARPMARMIAQSDGRAVRSGASAEVTAGLTAEITWPVEREHWNDEVAVPLLVTRCPLADPVTSPAASPAMSIGSASAPAADAEIALVTRTAGMLPPEHPATPPLLLQAAVLEMAHGRSAPAVAALAQFDAAGGARDNALALRERSDAVFTEALAAITDPAVAPVAAIEKSRAAFRLDLPATVRRSLALLLADRLMAAKRPDEAVPILGAPPHGDDAVGRYIAFRQVEAHARAGRRAELFAEAREALHRHGHADVEADPALGAIMDMALRTLEASPVSSETMEMLEALGPPRERLSRAQAFAEMALGAGAHASAMATYAWLYDNDTDSERRLQHLAHESVAAARAGARAEFARTFLLLAGQEETAARPSPSKVKVNAKAKGTTTAAAASTTAGDGALIASAEAEGHRSKQRAERSVDWQRALLVVARDALPALVDNDDQTDLGTLVATLKRHLDEAGRGPVDEELTTLYRAASAHLKSGPRAYAETVGAPRRPILLGEILDRPQLRRAPAGHRPDLGAGGDRTAGVRPPARRRSDARVAAPLAGQLPRQLDGRRFVTRRALWVAVPVALFLEAVGAGGARAQSLVDQQPEDPCVGARALDFADTTPAAEALRRSCRLERFQDRLAAERSQQVIVEEQTREARIQQWIDATQPWRVTRPLALEGFFGTGLASYGIDFSWDILRHVALGAWLGWRPISCQDANGNTTSSCGRTAYGLRARWYLVEHDFTPFVDTGLSFMSSNLALFSPSSGAPLAGTGRANSACVGAGVAFGYRSFRTSVEYVFEYTFYTGASLNDDKKTPSPELDAALSSSLRADRNGVRFQVGYAF